MRSALPFDALAREGVPVRRRHRLTDDAFKGCAPGIALARRPCVRPVPPLPFEWRRLPVRPLIGFCLRRRRARAARTPIDASAQRAASIGVRRRLDKNRRRSVPAPPAGTRCAPARAPLGFLRRRLGGPTPAWLLAPQARQALACQAACAAGLPAHLGTPGCSRLSSDPAGGPTGRSARYHRVRDHTRRWAPCPAPAEHALPSALGTRCVCSASHLARARHAHSRGTSTLRRLRAAGVPGQCRQPVPAGAERATPSVRRR